MSDFFLWFAILQFIERLNKYQGIVPFPKLLKTFLQLKP